MACILCLLLPLAAGAVPLPGASGQGDIADHARHVWPASAMFATDASEASRLSSFPSASSIELALRALQATKAQTFSATPASLLHVDLSRQVRLAVLTAPRWSKEARGGRTLDVSLLSLQW